MENFYNGLSGGKKVLFIGINILLSIPLGLIVGLMLGLMSTTFVPMCDNSTGGGHNCFEFNGMVGAEALGYIGLWAGAILIPLAYIALLIRWETKK